MTIFEKRRQLQVKKHRTGERLAVQFESQESRGIIYSVFNYMVNIAQHSNLKEGLKAYAYDHVMLDFDMLLPKTILTREMPIIARVNSKTRK